MNSGKLLGIVLLSLAAGACASAGVGAGRAGPPALAYDVPAGGGAGYTQGDTILVEVDAGGQTLQVSVVSTADLDLTFAPADGGVEVTATYTALDGVVDNPMTGAQTASVAEIDGPIVFNMDRRGVGTLVSSPELSGVAAQLVSPASFAASFFPRLPGRVVSPGDGWTDTIRVESTEAEGTTLSSTSVVTYTVVGDTLVEGRSLLKVGFTSQDERSTFTVQAGTEISQEVAGESAGYFLWDLAAGRMQAQVAEGTYNGTMNVTGAPFPLGMSMDVRSGTVSRAGG